jgi:hypothetical protein
VEVDGLSYKNGEKKEGKKNGNGWEMVKLVKAW